MSEFSSFLLGEVASLRKGINYKSEDYCNSDSGHLFITIKCFVKGGGYAPEGIKYYSGAFTKSDLLQSGDILFACTDLTRAGDIVGSPLKVPEHSKENLSLASMDCMRITPNPRLCTSDYLYHLLMLPIVRHQMVAYSAGSTVLHLENKSVPRIAITLPSTKRQKKIAAILSAADSAIEKTEALIAKYQQIKAGLMHDLFTRGVLPNGQLRPPRSEAPELYQETAIGWIPKDWRLSNCQKEFDICSGITLGPHRRPDKHSHPYLRVANVHRNALLLEDIATIEVFDGDLEAALQLGDLLVVEGHGNRAEIGRCAMVSSEAVGMLFQNHLFRLRPFQLDNNFALLSMNSHYAQGYWESACSTSSGLNTINRKMLGKMPVLVPSLNEQQLISVSANSFNFLIQSERDVLAKHGQKKLGLMQDLLTGRMPAKVDPREMADA
jgi:type I restriction enzyme, S subunit